MPFMEIEEKWVRAEENICKILISRPEWKTIFSVDGKILMEIYAPQGKCVFREWMLKLNWVRGVMMSLLKQLYRVLGRGSLHKSTFEDIWRACVWWVEKFNKIESFWGIVFRIVKKLFKEIFSGWDKLDWIESIRVIHGGCCERMMKNIEIFSRFFIRTLKNTQKSIKTLHETD